ncbi:DUF5004 domain-containing protein [Ferruginibacter lapsinanis]|uniref:DUF5004 domain-containing protein n=1 Tax=Ferruginibacter lapsinanis TaxID=563172 RepID=UPI001E490059|nr:DUF5004 domain-containing protein [Ferruginibacter lapsinanis]UEG49673.1 DUF5004 domain-containing protein [Ferruginibacter lapsinanis]
MRKHHILLSFIIICLLASCATSKEARTYKSLIDGNWQLQTVVTEGITGKVKIDLFNEADFQCFVGTSWTFDYRRSLGTYTTSNTNNCFSVKRNFRWSIYEAPGEPKLFQFKRLDEKLKEMDNGDGYRFTIVQLDKTTMQLKSTITFENKPAAIIYNFTKN